MTLVRTTFQPSELIDVSAREFAELERQGLLYASAQTLYVNFRSYTDGPPQDVEDLTVEITGPAPATDAVVAETSVGIAHIGRGSYSYAWGADVEPGEYTVTWTATDVDDAAVTATETVTVEAES